MVLTILPFTGLLGIDHMVLRSPLTAVLKVLSIIPLFGFWYFYDIAQATGERERIEKYGIAVPFYGPTGIGAGIFSGTEGIAEAPKHIAGPWKFLAYALTTCIFIAFPINKFVIGDYAGGISQILMYLAVFTLITPLLAIAWGFYDIYRVLFDTRGILEKGAARVLPASWAFGDYFKREALGPFDPEPPKPATSWLGRLVEAWMEVPISSAKLATGVVGAADAATVGIAKVVVNEATDTVKEAGNVASGAIQAAKVASNAISGSVAEGAKAAEGITGLLAKLPEIGEKVASELSDPNKLIEEAKKGAAVNPVLTGGALLLSAGSDNPSISTTAVLFSITLLAFSGYVFYTMRNTYKKPEPSDDPPSGPRAVRVTPQAHRT